MNDLTAFDQQLEMPLSKAANKLQDYVPDAVVFKQRNSKAALGLSIMSAGLEYQDIYQPLGINSGVWTKIINTGSSNFPNDNLGEFHKLVDNDIYIRWLANQCDLDVLQRKTTLEEQLLKKDIELEELKKEVATLMRAFNGRFGSGN